MFTYISFTMHDSIFKELSVEDKRDYIYRLFSPRINKLKDWNKFLEIFTLWASEEKLNDFYDAMMSGNSEYIAKLINDIKTKKTQIIQLKNNFSNNIMEYNENKTKQLSETEIDKQLSEI